MFWTERCNLFSIGEVLWRRKGGCLAFAHASRRTSSCICLSISTVFLFLLYLYFYCICISIVFVFLWQREVEWPGFGHARNQSSSCTSLHWSYPDGLLYFLWSRFFFTLYLNTCISFLRYTPASDGRWSMTGGRGVSGAVAPTHHSPALSALWFEGGWDGGVGVGGSTLVLVAMHMYMEGGRCTPAHSEQTRIRAAWLWKGLIRY